MRHKMIITKRKPVSVGEMVTEEFMIPLGITQGQLASAMGVSRRTVNELCTGKRSITVDTALMLAKVFGNTPNFWLNLQQRNDIWAALHSPKRMKRIERAKSIREAIA
jgi:addiction module HigA family antidote